MSVQSEITRLANAKTALATAIEGKGVTVPEGTKLDGMAALIESIEAGGGGDIKTITGTVTPSEDVSSIFTGITQDEAKEMFGGAFPTYLLGAYWIEEVTVDFATATFCLEPILPEHRNSTPHYYTGSTHSRGRMSVHFSFATGQQLELHAYNSTYGFMAGKTYRWVLIGV